MNPLSLVLMTLFRVALFAAIAALMLLCGIAHGQDAKVCQKMPSLAKSCQISQEAQP